MKAFLNDQCKEIEGNYRMGNTTDLFKRFQRTFQTKMGTIKDRNGKNLTEVENVVRIHRKTIQKRSS